MLINIRLEMNFRVMTVSGLLLVVMVGKGQNLDVFTAELDEVAGAAQR